MAKIDRMGIGISMSLQACIDIGINKNLVLARLKLPCIGIVTGKGTNHRGVALLVSAKALISYKEQAQLGVPHSRIQVELG